MKFKTVCYLLVQLMHCRKMFKAEIPFSNVMTCEDDDKVGVAEGPGALLSLLPSLSLPVAMGFCGPMRLTLTLHGECEKGTGSDGGWDSHVLKVQLQNAALISSLVC